MDLLHPPIVLPAIRSTAKARALGGIFLGLLIRPPFCGSVYEKHHEMQAILLGQHLHRDFGAANVPGLDEPVARLDDKPGCRLIDLRARDRGRRGITPTDGHRWKAA